MINKLLNYFGKGTKGERDNLGTNKNIAMLEERGICLVRNDFQVDFDSNQLLFKSKKHIAERAYLLHLVYMVSIGQMDAKVAIKYLETHSIFFKLTKKEYDFLNQRNYVLNTDFTWRIERIWILLWVLKKVDFPSFPIQTCCTTSVNKAFYQQNFLKEPDEFIKSCVEYRDKREVMVLLDLYLRLNWYAIENKLKGQQVQQFNERIVYERLYALQWVTQNKKLKWDESQLDYFKKM
jgi:hypothetical protein